MVQHPFLFIPRVAFRTDSGNYVRSVKHIQNHQLTRIAFLHVFFLQQGQPVQKPSENSMVPKQIEVPAASGPPWSLPARAAPAPGPAKSDALAEDLKVLKGEIQGSPANEGCFPKVLKGCLILQHPPDETPENDSTSENEEAHAGKGASNLGTGQIASCHGGNLQPGSLRARTWGPQSRCFQEKLSNPLTLGCVWGG